QEYLEQGWKLITDILDGGVGAVLDVKAKLPRDAIPEGIIHWRL
ncbi:MAG: nucleotide sugar dehydrogenase, partial [Proteobacteria bacterium]|nr:nucleotide sugar dehydrogenase [Pseudomonadota bacterium]